MANFIPRQQGSEMSSRAVGLGNRISPSIVIRVDASIEIGSGHLKRCLALADAMVESGARVEFVCRQIDVTAPALLGAHGFRTYWLKQAERHARPEAGEIPPHAAWARADWSDDASETIDFFASDPPDWVIVDHYALDARWHVTVRKSLGSCIAVIDDLADRPLSCNLLIDQNWHRDHAEKYRSCVTGQIPILGGPHHALLSAAFRTTPKYQHNAAVRSIGIFMGGTDPTNRSEVMLAACTGDDGFRGHVEVVSTTANPNLNSLRTAIERRPDTRLSLDLPDLSGFFARHDLQLGAGGSATWERCCMGVPSLTLLAAKNQRHVIESLGDLGVLRPVMDESATARFLGKEIRNLIEQPELRFQMARNARQLVDGQGAPRLARYVIERC